MESMTRTVTWKNVTDRAQMLSAYDARDAIGETGTQFIENRMTEGDIPAATEWAAEAAHMMEARMGSVLSCEGDYSSTGVTWTVIHKGEGNGFVKSAEEAMTAWVLAQWFSNRQTAMSTRYAGVWESMSAAAIKLAKRRRRPARPAAQQ